MSDARSLRLPRSAAGHRDAAETADYITHHLKIAGRTDTLFSADATALIPNASRGYPRAVNNLAVNALTAAFARSNPIVDEKQPASPSPRPAPTDRNDVTTPSTPCRPRPPVRTQRMRPSHTPIVGNTEDGPICKITDGQHPAPPVVGADYGEVRVMPGSPS